MFNQIEVSREIYGKKLSFSTGLLARQANGAVMTSIGETQVLGVATSSKTAQSTDFFPLQVHYNEKYYAAGRIPGSYFKREGKPTDAEVLVSRMIDRPLRPLFPKGFYNEVQIIPTTMNIDAVNPADVVGMNAASAALVVSDIPFSGPVGAVRIGYLNGKFIVNPTFDQLESEMELIVAGTEKAITMIEGDCSEFTEEKVLEAVDLAHKVIKEIIDLQKELREKAGKEKSVVELFEYDASLKDKLYSEYYTKMEEAIHEVDKSIREKNVSEVYQTAEKAIAETIEESLIPQISHILHDIEGEIVRKDILTHSSRSDGRSLEEIRPIDTKIDILNSVHGSSLFTRGQTQALAVATLSSPRNSLTSDEVSGEKKKNFYLHYNFPPYSVGEVGRIGATGRREVGHGMLAERSLSRVFPKNNYPYAVRVVSEILESNGSSSMATICAGSMALMASGVPLQKPVAGIAMGLIMEEDNFKVLTDIQGLEDHLGDMDFKVAGTKDGITGFQLDIKIEGITPEIMAQALSQAKKARLNILEKMATAIEKPRKNTGANAPSQKTVKVHVDKIRNIIGSGGKNIKTIVEESKADIDIEDNGNINVFASNHSMMEKAISMIELYSGVPKLEKTYTGLVKRITNFGAFVEIMPGTDGLLHISEVSHERIKRVEDVLKEGDKLEVKVIKIDDQNRINLSRKALL